jgi:hypothetical protein
MDAIKVIHDAAGHTLTIWLDDPEKESICEETADEVVLMKDASAKRVFLRVKVGGLLQMVAPQVEVLVLIGGCPCRRRQNPFRRSLKT